MKFLFSISFFIVFQCSYSQIGTIETSYTHKVGKIEKCIINKKGKNKCDWIARLGYKIVGSHNFYRFKYKAHYDDLGSKQRKKVTEIRFSANSQEVDYVYRQIEEWKSKADTDKPENIKIALGNYILEVSERRDGKKHELFLVFERKKAERDENFSTNGLLFNAEDLEKLFGI